MSNPILYILMRNDLDSLNPGKAMAQASHAANAFVFENEDNIIVKSWASQTTQGFGTVLVLEGDIVQIYDAVNAAKTKRYISGVVHDPTYPIRDGATTHFISLDTCGYVFVPDRSTSVDIVNVLSTMDLHR